MISHLDLLRDYSVVENLDLFRISTVQDLDAFAVGRRKWMGVTWFAPGCRWRCSL
jgi:hypothetical protein